MSDKSDEAAPQPVRQITAKIPKPTPPAGVPAARPTPPKLPTTPPQPRESTQIRSISSITPPKGMPAIKPEAKSLDDAFDDVWDKPTVIPTADKLAQLRDEMTETRPVPEPPADPTTLRARFEKDMRPQLARLLDVMLEIRFGQPQRAHLEPMRPALATVYASSEMLAAIHVPVERLVEVVDAALAGKSPIERRDDILKHYNGLAQQLPTLDLDAARAAREPIIIEALLWQVDGVERPTIDALAAAGLDRLEALATMTVDDITSMIGLRGELVTAILERFATYRNHDTALSCPDGTVGRKQLADAVAELHGVCTSFTTAATGWTDAARRDKRALRRPRALAYQRVRFALARLGEVELVRALDRKTFADRVASLA